MTEQQRWRELLMPGGVPVGKPGRSKRVRVRNGGLVAAREFFAHFEGLGAPVEAPEYNGTLLHLGGGDMVGLREVSESGEPTLDVNVRGVTFIKIKFES